MENISSLRRLLDQARQEASIAEHALRRAEARSRDTTLDLERLERAYPDALRHFVGRRKPLLMPLLLSARSTLDNSNLGAANMRQALRTQLAAKPVSAEPSLRLVDVLHWFLTAAANAAEELDKLRLATGSNLRPLHHELKISLDCLKQAGANGLVSQNRADADAANYWLTRSMQLLQMAPSLVEAELEWVAAQLEDADRRQALLEEQQRLSSEFFTSEQ